MYRLNIEISDHQNNEIFPQVIHMGLDYDFEAPDSFTKVVSNAPLGFSPKIDSFNLDPDTKITDIISQAYAYTEGLLVSKSLFSELTTFTLQPMVAYPACVAHHAKSYPYYWLHFTQKIEPEIDLERSEFVEIDEDGTSNSLRFANLAQLDSKCKSVAQRVTSRLTAHKIQFHSNIPSYDLFFLDLVPRLILVSNQLSDTLLSKPFTGFQITPSEVDVSFE